MAGGSWKVAYADFVTAMMAFFLLMWLPALLAFLLPYSIISHLLTLPLLALLCLMAYWRRDRAGCGPAAPMRSIGPNSRR